MEVHCDPCERQTHQQHVMIELFMAKSPYTGRDVHTLQCFRCGGKAAVENMEQPESFVDQNGIAGFRQGRDVIDMENSEGFRYGRDTVVVERLIHDGQGNAAQDWRQRLNARRYTREDFS